MTYYAWLSKMPFCCGMLEAGGFGSSNSWEYVGDLYSESSIQDLITCLLEEAEGRPIIFNFVKEHNYDGKFNDCYEYHELRTAVREHPHAKHLHKWHNPDGGNRIDAYIIAGYQDV